MGTHTCSFIFYAHVVDFCLICLLQVWCLFCVVSHKNVWCFLWVAVFQLMFTRSGSFDSTPWKAIVIFSGGTPGVPTIPNHPTVLAFNFKQFKVDLFHRSSSLDWVFGFFCWTLARLYPLLDLASKCEQKRHIQPQAHNQSFSPQIIELREKLVGCGLLKYCSRLEVVFPPRILIGKD